MEDKPRTAGEWAKLLTLNERSNVRCWMAWGLRANGIVELFAVSLTNKHHQYALGAMREAMRDDPDRPLSWIRIWGEERECDHLFGTGMSEGNLSLAEASMPNPTTHTRVLEAHRKLGKDDT